MKRLAIAFLLSLFAASASAQTTPHPCDVTAPPNPVIVKDAVIVGLCWPPKDAAGVIVPLRSFVVSIDGGVVLTWTGPSLTPTSQTTSAQGYMYYETQPVAVSRGQHTVAATATTADGTSAMSATFPFSTKGPGPSLVIGVRVR